MRISDWSSDVCSSDLLGFFPGSTIGNMVARTAVDLLRGWRATLGDGSLLLIGVDRIKDIAVLTRAYDDPAGVTAAFNLNLLERINRELGGTIRSDEHTSELQSLMRISYAVFRLKQKPKRSI